MLQFDKNKTTNKNAVYIDTFNTASGYYDSLVVSYSQSYDNSSGRFRVNPTSLPTQYRNWLVFENSGSLVPSPSGQYDVELFTATVDSEGRWGFVTASWQAVDGVWDEFGEGGFPIELITSDRAYISGSNETSTTQYVSPDETGKYVTYNG